MNFLNKLERKLGRFAIHGLMRYIILFYVAGYLIQYLRPEAYQFLTLDPYYIFHGGQVWRLISWLLIPPSNTNFIFVVIMLILYYQLGTALEKTWGAFKFNVFIFGGILFSILGALLLYVIYPSYNWGGSFSTYYINMTIFLAFAVCYPDMQIMLYFIIPIKMKWMAWFYAIVTVYTMVVSIWPRRVAILASLLNFLIFFFTTRNYRSISPKEVHRKQSYRKKVQQPKGITRHKCAVCGRTELDDPNLEFRFCSKCNGNYEYCQEHLFTHTHVK